MVNLYEIFYAMKVVGKIPRNSFWSYLRWNEIVKPRSGMNEGWSQVFQTSFIKILSASSLHKVFESFFWRLSTSRPVLINISWSNLIHDSKSCNFRAATPAKSLFSEKIKKTKI
jgi:hypothetical protein